jgi:catechol 2,3-dioxygenase-like lactoylglutathione lyase family enzyme
MTTATSSNTAVQVPEAKTVDFKLEVTVLPVADVDRAKAFYTQLGWREDADVALHENLRVVQMTPPGSPSSIIFGKGASSADAGPIETLVLAVDDIEDARADLIARGVNVSEVFHGFPVDVAGTTHQSGPDPDRNSYQSLARFNDPDGNGWLVQEVTTRLPGR